MPLGFDGRPQLDSAAIWRLVCAKLKESGLSEADGKRLGYLPMTGAEVAAHSLWGAHAYPAMYLPYIDPWTKAPMVCGAANPAPYFRVRCLLNPLPTMPPGKNGKSKKFPKYTQISGTMPRAYFPPSADWVKVLDSPDPLIITEGELKAASATCAGFPAIGLGGVWTFKSEKNGIEFLFELNRVVWLGRNVYIAYDSEPHTNPAVDQALLALATKLCERGAVVHRVTFPLLTEGAKTGLDDFLVARGAEALRALLKQAEEIPSWKLRYATVPGGYANNLDNAYTALRYAPELQTVFAFDQMAMVPAVVNPLPGEEEFAPRFQTDHDALLVQRWLQHEGGLLKIGTDSIYAAIQLRARERAFHPIRDHLNSLRWDGKPRLNAWLHDYIGAPLNEYTNSTGRMFMLSLIARVEEPGCKVDYAMVLEGDQGQRKSMLLRKLAGDAWFSDQLPKIGESNEVRLSQHLRGKWVIEIAELSAMRKADIEDVKSFITRQTEKYTPLYGRAEATEPRQCVFVGSTNDRKYLRDDTGNRRWWPQRADAVDIEGFSKARDQLLAEAVACYRAGEHWYPETEFELRVIRPEQNERFVGGEWDEDIQHWLDEQISFTNVGSPKAAKMYEVSSGQIAIDALGVEKKHKNTETLKRICAALRRLGWTEHKIGGNRTRWRPPKGYVDKVVADKKVVQFQPKRGGKL